MTGLMNATFTRGSTVRYEDTSSSEVDVAIVVSGALHYLDIFPALASVSARLGGCGFRKFWPPRERGI